jgi:hypothetical protein
MDIRQVRQYREVKVYGQGSPGGKGEGLIRINECDLPGAHKLPTHILATGMFDRYLERGRDFGEEERAVFAAICLAMGDEPIGVRSSATNESGLSGGRPSAVHAGEHISFMLPNNHPDPGVRFRQFEMAVGHIYDHFIHRQSGDDREAMGIAVNPIPGVFDDTMTGPVYYPYISGVANSYFAHALKTQDPREGFARIAFGHGYATVLDDFPVISMATIGHPIPLKLMRIGGGQRFFYSLDMTKNQNLQGDELETMKKLHVRFANFHKIKLLGIQNQIITIEQLVQNDQFGFRTGLQRIMEEIAARIAAHFQIEFVFNLNFRKKPYEDGVFHVVQLTLLPELDYSAVDVPKEVQCTYLSTGNLQGHGVKKGIKYALVVSPFLYRKDRHDEVISRMLEVNLRMRRNRESYVVIVPGRLGSRNRDWGIDVAYKDVDQAVAIFEYGVDIAGRAEPLPEEESMTGGIYGSHFLYMVLGGYSEDEKRMQTRMYGTQGTHFLTNLMSNNIFYGYISPNQDQLDPWFFSPPGINEAVYVLEFPKAVDIYADAIHQHCVIVARKD